MLFPGRAREDLKRARAGLSWRCRNERRGMRMGTEIHWVAVLAAAVAGFMVGGVWYSLLFGKAWMAARGVTREEIQAKGGSSVVQALIELLNARGGALAVTAALGGDALGLLSAA